MFVPRSIEGKKPYKDEGAAAVDGGVVRSDGPERRLAHGGEIERHGDKVSDDEDLEEPREDREHKRAHYVTDGPVPATNQMSVNERPENKFYFLPNVLAALAYESDGDSDTIAQEDEGQDDDDHQDGQDDDEGQPRLAQRQISVQIRRERYLREALVGPVDTFQLGVSFVAIPNACGRYISAPYSMMDDTTRSG